MQIHSKQRFIYAGENAEVKKPGCEKRELKILKGAEGFSAHCQNNFPLSSQRGFLAEDWGRKRRRKKRQITLCKCSGVLLISEGAKAVL